eukprot:190605-Rhodomonas_salina.3
MQHGVGCAQRLDAGTNREAHACRVGLQPCAAGNCTLNQAELTDATRDNSAPTTVIDGAGAPKRRCNKKQTGGKSHASAGSTSEKNR